MEAAIQRTIQSVLLTEALQFITEIFFFFFFFLYIKADDIYGQQDC